MNDLLRSVSRTYFRMEKGGDGSGQDPGEEDGKELHDLEGHTAGQVDLADFFRKVEDIKSNMVTMRQLLEEIQEAATETTSVTSAGAVQSLRVRMQSCVTKANKTARGVKAQLDNLEMANEASRAQAGCGPGSSTDRTRQSITLTLKHKLKELMRDFQALQQQIQDEYRETVARRVYIVTGQELDDKMVEDLIETGQSEGLLQKAIASQGRAQVTETLAEIQERHGAVVDLEKSLVELHQIFLDMAVLVDSQQELLNNIEHNVGRSASHIKRANVELNVAKGYQSNTRKYACCGAIVVLVVIVIVIYLVAK